MTTERESPQKSRAKQIAREAIEQSGVKWFGAPEETRIVEYAVNLALQQLPGGVCFAHGPHPENLCPQWPKCATDPQKPEFVAMGAQHLSTGKLPTREAPQDGIERAREYLAKQPHCIGYPKCDGDLTATPHSDECPISICSEPGLDELLASYAASEVSRVRRETLALLQKHEWDGGRLGVGQCPEEALQRISKCVGAREGMCNPCMQTMQAALLDAKPSPRGR